MTTTKQPIGARALTLRREHLSPARLGLLIALLGLASVGALRAEALPAAAATPAPAVAASATSALPGVTAQAATLSKTLSSAALAAHGHRHGHYRGHRGHYRYRHYPRSYGFYFGFPYFSLGYYGHGYYGHGYRYGYHRYPYGHYGPAYYRAGSEPLGGVDIDVKPKKAEVFLDGRAIGTVRQFDGFPSYLWLEQGTYELAIYMEGYQTLEREIAVLPGVVIDVEGRLVPGEAVRPEAPAETASAVDGDGGVVGDAGPGYDRPRRRAERAPEGGGEPPRLAVSVAPADAAVYLDGHFLGTAEDLARLSAGMMISPGRHTVEVVRPGYRSATRDIEVRPGQRFELDLSLEPR